MNRRELIALCDSGILQWDSSHITRGTIPRITLLVPRGKLTPRLFLMIGHQVHDTNKGKAYFCDARELRRVLMETLDDEKFE